MSRLLLSLSLLLFASNAHAETVTTTTFTAGGTVNCQFIQVNVTRIEGASPSTQIDLSIRQCGPGSTVPNVSIASFISPIPSGDFTTDKSGAHLKTQSPYGFITLDWAYTPTAKSAYDARWTTYAPDNHQESQHDDIQSVRGVGSIGSTTVDRVGMSDVSVFRR